MLEPRHTLVSLNATTGHRLVFRCVRRASRPAHEHLTHVPYVISLAI